MPKEYCMFCDKEIFFTEEEYEQAVEISKRSAFVLLCTECEEQERLADLRHAEEFKKEQEDYEKLKAKLIASGEAYE